MKLYCWYDETTHWWVGVTPDGEWFGAASPLNGREFSLVMCISTLLDIPVNEIKVLTFRYPFRSVRCRTALGLHKIRGVKYQEDWDRAVKGRI
jgi:hypothetical protein